MSRLYLAHGVAPHLHRRRRTWRWWLAGVGNLIALAALLVFFVGVVALVWAGYITQRTVSP